MTSPCASFREATVAVPLAPVVRGRGADLTAAVERVVLEEITLIDQGTRSIEEECTTEVRGIGLEDAVGQSRGRAVDEPLQRRPARWTMIRLKVRLTTRLTLIMTRPFIVAQYRLR